MIYMIRNNCIWDSRVLLRALLLILLMGGGEYVYGQETEQSIRERYKQKAERIRGEIKSLENRIDEDRWDMENSLSETIRIQSERDLESCQAQLSAKREELNNVPKECDNEISQLRQIQNALNKANTKAAQEHQKTTQQKNQPKKQPQKQQKKQPQKHQQKAKPDPAAAARKAEQTEKQKKEDQANYTKNYNASISSTSAHYGGLREQAVYNTSHEAMDQRREVGASMRANVPLDNVQRSSTQAPPPVKTSRGLDKLKKETGKSNNENKKEYYEFEYY